MTIDEELVRSARKIALDRNTSVNNLVREFLVALVSESGAQNTALDQVEEFFRTRPFSVGKKAWTRESLHER